MNPILTVVLIAQTGAATPAPQPTETPNQAREAAIERAKARFKNQLRAHGIQSLDIECMDHLDRTEGEIDPDYDDQYWTCLDRVYGHAAVLAKRNALDRLAADIAKQTDDSVPTEIDEFTNVRVSQPAEGKVK